MPQYTEYTFTGTIDSVERLLKELNAIAMLKGDIGLYEPMNITELKKWSSKSARNKGYKTFTIPKKSGGSRSITAPASGLKSIQSALNALLQAIFTPAPNAMGFVTGRNIMTNAAVHTGQTCIFNIDLENFFPSITKSMVRSALERELGGILTDRGVINMICSLCTVPDKNGNEVLPQGAPTSPVISNIVLKRMDDELHKVAERYSMRYTRYADDMTFSHSKQMRRMSSLSMQRIAEVIGRHKFKINESKTHTGYPGCRREVTGVVVSDKLNVSREFVKQLRTLLHLWKKYGYAQAQTIYTRDFCSGEFRSLRSVINGKINYMSMIKGKDDPTCMRLRSNFNLLKWLDRQARRG